MEGLPSVVQVVDPSKQGGNPNDAPLNTHNGMCLTHTPVPIVFTRQACLPGTNCQYPSKWPVVGSPACAPRAYPEAYRARTQAYLSCVLRTEVTRRASPHARSVYPGPLIS